MKKISTKVLIPVVLLAVIAVISAVTGLKNANELHTSSKEISDTTVNQLMLLNDISSNFKSIDAITYRMCVSTSKDERDQLMEQVDQYRTDIQTSIDSYEALTQTQEEAAAMETLRENFADYTEVYDRIADFISRGNKDKAETDMQYGAGADQRECGRRAHGAGRVYGSKCGCRRGGAGICIQ